VVFLSPCLLNRNTRYLGRVPAGCGGRGQAQNSVTAGGSPMNWSTERTFPSSSWK
jgi:hypothetical protein